MHGVGLVLSMMVAAQATANTPVQRTASRSIFVEGRVKANVEKDCLNAVTEALKSAIPKTSNVTAAKSDLDADVVVKVTECATVWTARTSGVSELTVSSGGRRGRGARLAVGTELSSEAKVTLAVNGDGKTFEFTSGPDMLPVEAARAATRALLTWVQSLSHDFGR